MEFQGLFYDSLGWVSSWAWDDIIAVAMLTACMFGCGEPLHHRRNARNRRF